MIKLILYILKLFIYGDACWHKWSKWKLIEIDLNYDGIYGGSYTVQKCICDKCGKIKIRKII